MKRLFDIILSLLIFLPVAFVTVICMILVKVTSKGPVIHWSRRVGRNNSVFKMAKLRTMYVNTPDVATHLLDDSREYITPVGSILRKLSLDEFPQLFNIIKGDMSFVGPRPALHNQADLIKLRTDEGIHLLRPGLTGWAQINGRDDISIVKKVELDKYYIENCSLLFDCKILLGTFISVINSRGVAH